MAKPACKTGAGGNYKKRFFGGGKKAAFSRGIFGAQPALVQEVGARRFKKREKTQNRVKSTVALKLMPLL